MSKIIKNVLVLNSIFFVKSLFINDLFIDGIEKIVEKYKKLGIRHLERDPIVQFRIYKAQSFERFW